MRPSRADGPGCGSTENMKTTWVIGATLSFALTAFVAAQAQPIEDFGNCFSAMLEGFPSGAYTFRPTGPGQTNFTSLCEMDASRSRAWLLVRKGAYDINYDRRASISDAVLGARQEVLMQARLDLEIPANPSFLWWNSNESGSSSLQNMFVADPGAIVIPPSRADTSSVWESSGPTVECSNTSSNGPFYGASFFNVNCIPGGVGSHLCGSDNGLLHRGGSYNLDGNHPCPTCNGISCHYLSHMWMQQERVLTGYLSPTTGTRLLPGSTGLRGSTGASALTSGSPVSGPSPPSRPLESGVEAPSAASSASSTALILGVVGGIAALCLMVVLSGIFVRRHLRQAVDVSETALSSGGGSQADDYRSLSLVEQSGGQEKYHTDRSNYANVVEVENAGDQTPDQYQAMPEGSHETPMKYANTGAAFESDAGFSSSSSTEDRVCEET
jgi:hypothetical protein